MLTCDKNIRKPPSFLNVFETEQLQIGNWVQTRQNCLVFQTKLQEFNIIYVSEQRLRLFRYKVDVTDFVTLHIRTIVLI